MSSVGLKILTSARNEPIAGRVPYVLAVRVSKKKQCTKGRISYGNRKRSNTAQGKKITRNIIGEQTLPFYIKKNTRRHAIKELEGATTRTAVANMWKPRASTEGSMATHKATPPLYVAFAEGQRNRRTTTTDYCTHTKKKCFKNSYAVTKTFLSLSWLVVKNNLPPPPHRFNYDTQNTTRARMHTRTHKHTHIPARSNVHTR